MCDICKLDSVNETHCFAYTFNSTGLIEFKETYCKKCLIKEKAKSLLTILIMLAISIAIFLVYVYFIPHKDDSEIHTYLNGVKTDPLAGLFSLASGGLLIYAFINIFKYIIPGYKRFGENLLVKKLKDKHFGVKFDVSSNSTVQFSLKEKKRNNPNHTPINDTIKWACPKCNNTNPNTTFTCTSCNYSLK